LITITAGFPASASVTAQFSNSFNPASVDISVGGTVNFTFETLHNVTFTSGAGTPPDIPNTSTGTVGRTFSTAGTITYTCTIHPGMNGTVIVH
jgi:plastocyanin